MDREDVIALNTLRRCSKELSDTALLCPGRAESLRAFALILDEWAEALEAGEVEPDLP